MRIDKGDDGSLTLLLGLGLAASFAAAVVRHRKTPFDSLFEEQGKLYRIEPDMLRAIAKTESDMQPTAVSKPNVNGSRDYGLMQVNDRTAKVLGLSDPKALLDPAVAIRTASILLDRLRTELGASFNPYTWVASYNAGSPAIKARGIFNLEYVSRVFFHWQLFAIGRAV
jgi:soluble lytic murein transglycosylase-like protein